ncbi:MAG: addiction module protein [Deltaproteobacteria bacterium]|nr:addiction module protein [Deltaproteobacteria bacterium]
MATHTLLDQALGLPLNQRAQLAAALLRSLDGDPDGDVEAAWTAEIQKRVREIDAGTASLDHWPDVRERARKRLREQ